MSVTVDAATDVRSGVALVTVRVANAAAVDRRVRVENRLPGPVLPPRRRGVPAAGWDDGGCSVVVAADDARALGYACPVGDRPLPDAPVELAAVGDPESHRGDPVDAAVRELGDHRPPRDALPTPDADASALTTASDDATTDSTESEIDTEAVAAGVAAGDDDALVAEQSDPAEVPESVAAYFDCVERRVSAAERLTGASVPEATRALSEQEGSPEALASAVAADAEAVRAVAVRAAALADRAEAVDVPVDALRRLA
ncbi:hypothetical protein [Halobaculum sp. D14]|uniref:DUF7857 domain-containing protein n=1 Tax=Halobaculum sp. D14 TaxID=3421642 RepID=UPI003EBB812C